MNRDLKRSNSAFQGKPGHDGVVLGKNMQAFC